MSKKLPVKYISEKAVKKALNIDSFRNITKDKIMEFTSMIPYMDKDIAISIINQFPVFADFGKTAISEYLATCDRILEQNKTSQIEVIKGFQFTLSKLSELLEDENLSPQDKLAISDKMILINKELAEFDAQNKKFLLKTLKIVGGVVLGISFVVGAALGINSAQNGNGLPQLKDDDDDDTKK